MFACHLADRARPEQSNEHNRNGDNGGPGPVEERLQGELRRDRPVGWDQQQLRHTRIFVQFVVFWAALQSPKHSRPALI